MVVDKLYSELLTNHVSNIFGLRYDLRKIILNIFNGLETESYFKKFLRNEESAKLLFEAFAFAVANEDHNTKYGSLTDIDSMYDESTAEEIREILKEIIKATGNKNYEEPIVENKAIINMMGKISSVLENFDKKKISENYEEIFQNLFRDTYEIANILIDYKPKYYYSKELFGEHRRLTSIEPIAFLLMAKYFIMLNCMQNMDQNPPISIVGITDDIRRSIGNHLEAEMDNMVNHLINSRLDYSNFVTLDGSNFNKKFQGTDELMMKNIGENISHWKFSIRSVLNDFGSHDEISDISHGNSREALEGMTNFLLNWLYSLKPDEIRRLDLRNLYPVMHTIFYEYQERGKIVKSENTLYKEFFDVIKR